MEARVGRLEEDMRDVKATLLRMEAVMARIEAQLLRLDAQVQATLPHLATKAELSDFRAEIKVALADKPSKTYMWGILGVLLTAYACGLAGLAVLR